MLQIFQDLRNGETSLVDIPKPEAKSGGLLIETKKTVVSAGTERMLVNFGKAGYIQKAKQQPDKVKMVLNKIKTDGLIPTYEAVTSKLDQPLPLGYCNAGVVVESKSQKFKKGDRVVSNGSHAEYVQSQEMLCAKIPDSVSDESAAFTVLASIGLQGVRLLKPTIGETIVVFGLGLIGLITVQILKANGCKVLGVDFDEAKCSLAEDFGAETVNLSKGEDILSKANSFSDGYGIDGVLITAATDSNELISQAANILRKRGRIILVGVVGLELSRADFYEKEITFQVSCSYGPGRYDDEYEINGNDYPIGFVRWTEERNFNAVLDMMANGDIKITPLITHRYAFSNALEAYQELNNPKALGILLEYRRDAKQKDQNTVIINHDLDNKSESIVRCGFIGAGNYASRILIPAFKKSGAKLDTIVTSGGASAAIQGKKHGFKKASTSIQSINNSTKLNTVVIATRHNLHARQVIDSLKHNKNVFVEKPLAINREELEEIKKLYRDPNKTGARLMVGFNRRFSPHVVRLKSLLDIQIEPKAFIMTINAGAIPLDHWTQQDEIGGGRIIGEVCHFIDLLRFLSNSPIKGFKASKIGNLSSSDTANDKVLINLEFENGSIGAIHYLSNGGKSFPKERLEVFCNDAVIQLDNYKKMRGFGWKGFKSLNLFSQDKGQNQCVKVFVDSIENGLESPIDIEEIFEVSDYSLKISEYIRNL